MCRRTTGQWDLKAARRHLPNRSDSGTSRPRLGVSLKRWRACAIPSRFPTVARATSPTWPRSPALTHSARPEAPNSSPACGIGWIRSAGPSSPLLSLAIWLSDGGAGSLVDFAQGGDSQAHLLDRGLAQEGHAVFLGGALDFGGGTAVQDHFADAVGEVDRKSTRLNS